MNFSKTCGGSKLYVPAVPSKFSCFFLLSTCGSRVHFLRFVCAVVRVQNFSPAGASIYDKRKCHTLKHCPKRSRRCPRNTGLRKSPWYEPFDCVSKMFGTRQKESMGPHPQIEILTESLRHLRSNLCKVKHFNILSNDILNLDTNHKFPDNLSFVD